MSDSSSSRPLVTFAGVSKRYGGVTAVHTMNLEIYEGEFLAIMGPSGCGKTTSLRMLAGLEEPSDGEIRLDGQRINEISSVERDTPMVWQSLALFPFLNVQKNVEFGLKMRQVPAEERQARASKWLERMEGGFAENSVSYLLIMRLVPAVPFFVANIAPAFLGARTVTFIWTTLVGIIPGTVVYISVGAGLGTELQSGEVPDLGVIFEWHVLGPLLGLAALAALPAILKAVRGARS